VVAGCTAALAALDAHQLSQFDIELFATVELPFVKALPAEGFAFRVFFASGFAELVEIGWLAQGLDDSVRS
jgi:hypothetical protein